MLATSPPWRTFCRAGFALQLGAVVLIASLAWLGLVPTRLARIPNIDLMGHATLIGLLAFFLDGALDYRPLLRARAAWLRAAPALVLSVAGLEEFLQRFGVHRTSSWSDFAADLIGVVVLTWLSKRIAEARSRSAHARHQGLC